MIINILSILLFSLLTLMIYQSMVVIQRWSCKVWLNPMLLAILIIIPSLIIADIDYQVYAKSTHILSWLLEPAVVALGFPLYQHLPTIKRHWLPICMTLAIATCFTLVGSFLLTMQLIGQSDVAISLALKSITTPIGLALTQQYHGNEAITAIAIIIAGITGAVFGIKWLSFLNIHSVKAQGLAVGAASHALGTATISQISFQHAAYSSLALIVSAIFTAFISPMLLPFLLSFSY